MPANSRDVTFGTFNLYNLQLPGKPWRGKKTYSQEDYDAKVAWSADRLVAMDADVIGFQELWSRQCLVDIFQDPRLSGQYDLAFIKDDWYDIAVAAAVRAPWAIRGKRVHKAFPDGLVLQKRGAARQPGDADDNEDEDDDIAVQISLFSRSVLQLTIGHGERNDVPAIEVFAVHLKSKLPTRLDAQESGQPAVRAHATALGAAISTIRRTAEAAALRVLLNLTLDDTNTPVAVLGDCNDSPNSNTLAILTDQPSYRFYADSRSGRTSDKGLYAASALQALRSFRDVDYTHVHKGEADILDHVLVSEQFYDHSEKRLWSFREMRVWNDHIPDHGDTAASDHGIVTARFDWNKP